MAMDDYFFKTPGSVPFKWEIRPGVPKVQQHHHQQPPVSNHRHSHSSFHQEHHSTNHNRSSPTTPKKLSPPPAGFTFQPHSDLRTHSVLSVQRTRSQRNRFVLAQPEIVSTGCFTKPVMTSKEKKKKKRSSKLTMESEPETDYTSDLETLSRWSVSTRKSLSPFRESSPSSSFSSYQSSPRLVSDVEWAGFGLF